MQMRITKYGEPVLKQKAEKVEVFDSGLEKLANDMFESMCEANGIGLAAPQVGVSKRMFVIDMRRRYDADTPCNFTLDGKSIPLELAMPLVAVNPEVENAGEYVETAEEGCLSFPAIYGEVERFYKVRLVYSDLKGARHEIVCDGLFARCIQHENDHLDGITFVDRLQTKELLKISAKLKKLKRASRDFLKGKNK
ncbi:MAG: peptide deformylase [Opitutales bacterium]|nr:peptide deformylase [Opitutales bacterium]